MTLGTLIKWIMSKGYILTLTKVSSDGNSKDIIIVKGNSIETRHDIWIENSECLYPEAIPTGHYCTAYNKVRIEYNSKSKTKKFAKELGIG